MLPGFFILEKNAALVISPLRIHAEPVFKAKELELMERAGASGKISRESVVQAVTDLLVRMATKVDTDRGAFS